MSNKIRYSIASISLVILCMSVQSCVSKSHFDKSVDKILNERSSSRECPTVIENLGELKGNIYLRAGNESKKSNIGLISIPIDGEWQLVTYTESVQAYENGAQVCFDVKLVDGVPKAENIRSCEVDHENNNDIFQNWDFSFHHLLGIKHDGKGTHNKIHLIRPLVGTQEIEGLEKVIIETENGQETLYIPTYLLNQYPINVDLESQNLHFKTEINANYELKIVSHISNEHFHSVNPPKDN